MLAQKTYAMAPRKSRNTSATSHDVLAPFKEDARANLASKGGVGVLVQVVRGSPRSWGEVGDRRGLPALLRGRRGPRSEIGGNGPGGLIEIR